MQESNFLKDIVQCGRPLLKGSFTQTLREHRETDAYGETGISGIKMVYYPDKREVTQWGHLSSTESLVRLYLSPSWVSEVISGA